MAQLLHTPVFRVILLAVSFTLLVHLISALTLDRRVQYVELRVRSEKITPGQDYTVAFLTDVHSASDKRLESVVAELSGREPDAVLLGGDFTGGRMERALDILSQIPAADGFYGVPGNHDDASRLRQAMEDRGMVQLENQGAALGEGLYLAGVEDRRRGDPDLAAALEGAGEDDFVLVLSHNPDVTMEQDFSRADLTLCGHTHGGEVTLFGLWSPLMYLVSGYGQRFRTGMCQSAAGTDVYVSHGVGSHSSLRAFCRPQVILVYIEGRE